MNKRWQFLSFNRYYHHVFTAKKITFIAECSQYIQIIYKNNGK